MTGTKRILSLSKTYQSTTADRSKYLDFIAISQDSVEIPLNLSIDSDDSMDFDLQALQSIYNRTAFRQVERGATVALGWQLISENRK